MKVLVTGGAGFIGSHVCAALLEDGHDVVCLDNFNDYYSPEQKRKNISGFKERFYLEEADICDLELLLPIFKKHNFDQVVHLAARAGVRPSIADPRLYEEVNLKGTLNLLELCRRFQINKFIFGSSSSVYGKNSKIPFSEDDATDSPISPYAATKKAGELLCYNYSHLYNMNIICLRFFTVYGPKGRPDMAPYLFTKQIIEGSPIIRYGNGDSKRDYTYIKDIVQGVMAAVGNSFRFEILNLGNSSTVKLNQLISIIESLTGKKAKIIEKPAPKGDVYVTYADISKSKKLLNYAPTTDIKEGMRKFVEWYQSQ